MCISFIPFEDLLPCVGCIFFQTFKLIFLYLLNCVLNCFFATKINFKLEQACYMNFLYELPFEFCGGYDYLLYKRSCQFPFLVFP